MRVSCRKCKHDGETKASITFAKANRKCFVCTRCGAREAVFTVTPHGEDDPYYDDDDDGYADSVQREIARDEGLGWRMGITDDRIFVDDDFDYYDY